MLVTKLILLVKVSEMEKAILKTLIYADLFDYPLKAWEIHKWLIGKKANLREVEKALKKLSNKKQVTGNKGYFFLKNKKTLVVKRFKREKQSEEYLKDAKLISFIFRLIPWIKLVGISGSLAIKNSNKKDDIDLFIITSKGRMFLSRAFLIFITGLLGRRRKRRENRANVAGKICINLLLEEDNLAISKGNIYLAHEVLQMQVLWQRDGVYQKYLEQNFWAFNFLPNWITTEKQGQRSKLKSQKYNSKFKIFDALEKFSKSLQLKYMGKPEGTERVTDGGLYFHPNDYGPKILSLYKERIRKIN